jgi:hypothetical protein
MGKAGRALLVLIGGAGFAAALVFEWVWSGGWLVHHPAPLGQIAFAVLFMVAAGIAVLIEGMRAAADPEPPGRPAECPSGDDPPAHDAQGG